MTEIRLIQEEIKAVRNIFLNVVERLPSFDITNPEILPYGLKPHTRSVCWIVEQVVTQQAKYHASRLGLRDVDISMPDTCLHDCIVYKEDKHYYVNVKIHNADGRDNKNDISAVEKLYMFYSTQPDYRLIYACFGVRFRNLTIEFAREGIHVFSPQFLPIYVNPRNDKIQAYYEHEPQYRTRRQFLRLLRENSKSIVLGEER